jgi:cytochrome c
MTYHRILGLKAIFLLLNLCFVQISFGQDIELGKTIYSQCIACHSLDNNLQQIGPSLAGVVNRKMGSVADYRYSNALRNSNGVWSPEKLNAFLENPQAALPGNRMPYSGLTNPAERSALIAYLATLKP